MLYRATMPYASICAGVVAEDGRVVRAAPVFGWAVDKTMKQFSAWVARKGGQVERVS